MEVNHFYTKLAILTDNNQLAKEFYNIIKNYTEQGIQFTFYISPYSNLSTFDLKSVKIIDLKKEREVEELIKNHDLIFSIHSKQLFPPNLVNNIKCINVHPGYNPINRGWYPQIFAIINKTDIGATIHEIDEKLDHGNIIARKKVEHYIYDTSLSLYNRIVDAEIELLEKYIPKILKNDYDSINPENEGNLYLKSDFNKLRLIDLNKTATYGEVIDHLRALSHGSYKNAYFYDNMGNKIYIRIELEKTNTEI